MSQDTTGIDQPVIDQENDTLNDGIQADEVASGAQPASEDVDKKEETIYEKELRELREANAKKDEIIEKKNRAIQSLKKEKGESEDPEKEALLERLERLENNVSVSEVKKTISQFTEDSAEKELIEHHYHNSIVKTGDMAKDVQMAMAIANQNVVIEQKRNQAIEQGNENFLASFSKAGAVRGETPSITANPVQRAAEELVRSINPNAVKFVKDQF